MSKTHHLIILPVDGLPFIHSTHSSIEDIPLALLRSAIDPSNPRVPVGVCYRRLVFVKPEVAAINRRWAIAKNLLKESRGDGIKAWLDDEGMYRQRKNPAIGLVPESISKFVYGNVLLVVPDRIFVERGLHPRDFITPPPAAAAAAVAAAAVATAAAKPGDCDDPSAP